MEMKEYDELERLFWKYCKTFEKYDEFVTKKYTREEILRDIKNRQCRDKNG